MEEQKGLWGCSADRRLDSSSSTPYESTACSPRSSTDIAMSCFFSASTPTCPAKVTLNIDALPSTGMGFMSSSKIEQLEDSASDEFDFSSRFSEVDQPWSPAPMSSADELFCNGRIRPLWYTGHEDLPHLYSAHSVHNYNDDDSHFDFRSSADYKFTMLSLPLSPAKSQQYGGYDYSGQYHNQVAACLHEPLSMEDAIDKGGGVQRTHESLPRQSSRRHDVDIIAKHVMKVKVEESRGRRASSSKEGGIRRTRSLSPLRVFHMDDELPRQSFEATQSSPSAKEDNDSVEQGEKWRAVELTRKKGVRLTLKDLLHASEQAEEEACNRRRAQIGSKQQRKAYMETKLNENNTLPSKSSPKHSLESSTKGSNHFTHVQGPRSPGGLHYSSPRVHMEQMRRQTFLPYRHGLLACLGFSSKRYRSVAGIKSLHSKSQGMR